MHFRTTKSVEYLRLVSSGCLAMRFILEIREETVSS